MENKSKFIKSFTAYSTIAVITGAIVLIETVPGLKYDTDSKNQFYVNIHVKKDSYINLELQNLNEFDNIEIYTLNGSIDLRPDSIEQITYLNNNSEIVISMVDSVKYYTGIFNYGKGCYIFEENLCKNSKNEIFQYILGHNS